MSGGEAPIGTGLKNMFMCERVCRHWGEIRARSPVPQCLLLYHRSGRVPFPPHTQHPRNAGLDIWAISSLMLVKIGSHGGVLISHWRHSSESVARRRTSALTYIYRLKERARCVAHGHNKCWMSRGPLDRVPLH